MYTSACSPYHVFLFSLSHLFSICWLFFRHWPGLLDSRLSTTAWWGSQFPRRSQSPTTHTTSPLSTSASTRNITSKVTDIIVMVTRSLCTLNLKCNEQLGGLFLSISPPLSAVDFLYLCHLKIQTTNAICNLMFVKCVLECNQ